MTTSFKKKSKKRGSGVIHAPKTVAANLRQEPRRLVHLKRLIELWFDLPKMMVRDNKIQERMDGNLLDVSSKGLGLFTVNEIRPGTKVRILFQDSSNPYNLVGQVVWCRKIPSTNIVFKVQPSMQWRVGLMLVENENQEDIKLFRSNLEAF